MTRPRRSFTLVETLLALALVALLSGSVFGFIAALGERRKALDLVAHREEGASVLCEQLEYGLLCCVAGDTKMGPGLSGDSGSIKILSRGVRMASGKEALHPTGDLVASEYTFDSGAGLVRARRWEAGHPDPDAELLVEHVRSLKVRYRDGSEWVDTFDSLKKDHLPSAVEISIWFGDPAPAPDSPEAKDKPPIASDRASAPSPDRIRLFAVADVAAGATSETSAEGGAP